MDHILIRIIVKLIAISSDHVSMDVDGGFNGWLNGRFDGGFYGWFDGGFNCWCNLAVLGY